MTERHLHVWMWSNAYYPFGKDSPFIEGYGNLYCKVCGKVKDHRDPPPEARQILDAFQPGVTVVKEEPSID